MMLVRARAGASVPRRGVDSRHARIGVAKENSSPLGRFARKTLASQAKGEAQPDSCAFEHLQHARSTRVGAPAFNAERASRRYRRLPCVARKPRLAGLAAASESPEAAACPRRRGVPGSAHRRVPAAGYVACALGLLRQRRCPASSRPGAGAELPTRCPGAAWLPVSVAAVPKRLAPDSGIAVSAAPGQSRREASDRSRETCFRGCHEHLGRDADSWCAVR
jgi:hypothetical protein